MLKNYDDLSPVAIDCLREIGNIGSGSAASSLSEMLGKTIEMKVPNVCVLEYQQIIDAMGGPEKVITGILVRLEGDIKGMMMFLLEDSFAQVVLVHIHEGGKRPGHKARRYGAFSYHRDGQHHGGQLPPRA